MSERVFGRFVSEQFGELLISIAEDQRSHTLWEAPGSRSAALVGRVLSLRIALPEFGECHGQCAWLRGRLNGSFSNVPSDVWPGIAQPFLLQGPRALPFVQYDVSAGEAPVFGGFELAVMADRALHGRIFVQRPLDSGQPGATYPQRTFDPDWQPVVWRRVQLDS